MVFIMKQSFKNLLWLLLAIYFFQIDNIKANNDEEEETQVNHLHILPARLIRAIGDYLYDNDFRNFSFSSKKIFIALNQPSMLFLPKDQEALIKMLQHTSFEDLEPLALKGSRTKKPQFLAYLEEITPKFANHKFVLPMVPQDYEQKMANFAMDLKCKMMLYFLQDSKSTQEIINLKEEKIKAYYKDDEDLDNSPAASQLMITQGIIISHDILQKVRQWDAGSFEDTKNRAQEDHKIFPFVTKFFQKFKAPIEEEI